MWVRDVANIVMKGNFANKWSSFCYRVYSCGQWHWDGCCHYDIWYTK